MTEVAMAESARLQEWVQPTESTDEFGSPGPSWKAGAGRAELELVPMATAVSPADRMLLLLSEDAPLGDALVDRPEILGRVAALARTLKWSSLDYPLAVHLGVNQRSDV